MAVGLRTRPIEGNRLVRSVGAAIEGHTTRRQFVARTTLFATAAVVSRGSIMVRPGVPYQVVTGCPDDSLCSDGYTDFCCTINNGVNACPPDTVAAGWWRADHSAYCDGPRFYIDCNEVCCTRPVGDFCLGCGPCQCRDGCDSRIINCLHFRYGQCGQDVEALGAIACRMVTCVPPYLLDLGCTDELAVDNLTANHITDCLLDVPRSGGPTRPAAPSAWPSDGVAQLFRGAARAIGEILRRGAR